MTKEHDLRATVPNWKPVSCASKYPLGRFCRLSISMCGVQFLVNYSHREERIFTGIHISAEIDELTGVHADVVEPLAMLAGAMHAPFPVKTRDAVSRRGGPSDSMAGAGAGGAGGAAAGGAGGAGRGAPGGGAAGGGGGPRGQ